MKTSISHLLNFILMIILYFTILFSVYEVSISKKNIIKLLNDNYYNNSYNNIISEIDNYIVNNEVLELYNKYLSKEMVKEDINIIINNIYQKNNQLSKYNDFYKIINSYTDDTEICDIYANNINNIYIKNILPISELTLINKTYIGRTSSLFISIILSSIVVILSVILFLINKNFKYYKISLLSVSMLLLIPKMLVSTLFSNFQYTNQYFTHLLLKIINSIVNILSIIGLITIILLIFNYLKRLVKNKKIL